MLRNRGTRQVGVEVTIWDGEKETIEARDFEVFSSNSLSDNYEYVMEIIREEFGEDVEIEVSM